MMPCARRRRLAAWLHFVRKRPAQIAVSMLLLIGLIATVGGPFRAARLTTIGCGYGYTPGSGYGYSTCPPPPPPPSINGYWLVASDGGIFSFHAPFYGSGPGFATQFGDVRFATPVVAIGAQAGGTGYWIASAGGGVLPLAVPFLGSAAGIPLHRPVVAIAVRA